MSSHAGSTQDIALQRAGTSHPRMPMSERAKIFVPFNPLKGFSEALRAKEREVEVAALDDRGGNDLEAPDSSTRTAEARVSLEAATGDAVAGEVGLEEYLTAEDMAEASGGHARQGYPRGRAL